MSRPTRNTAGRRPADARLPDAGIARPAGLALSAVIAAGVFIAGQQLFPVRKPAPPPPPAPVEVAPPVPPPVPPTPPVAEPSVVDATAADAASAVAKTPPADEPEPAIAASEAGLSPAARKALQQDRELAREAWRRNRPDVTSGSNKTSVLIPIRGSTAGSSSKVLRKSRTVVVTLPKAISMITMRVYNLKHPVFHRVWIDQDEANAKPSDGSKLRIVLGHTYDPQVEITEDFVRVSVRRAEPGSEPAEAKRSEKKSEKTQEKPEKTEKTQDENDAPAPAGENE
jgi:hypothetical protein